MKTAVDERLREEARRFAFRFCCDDCVHAAGASLALRCSLGFPAAPRQGALVEPQVELCKAFELG